jgi:uncharacterized RDD family membrane protein YckC
MPHVLAVEGALAPDPRHQARVEPLRELPGRRKRAPERSWKDDVRERMDRRRQRGGPAAPSTGGPLPLFPEPRVSTSSDDPETTPSEVSRMGDDSFASGSQEMRLDDVSEPEVIHDAQREEGFEPLGDMRLNSIDEVLERSAPKPAPEGSRLLEEPVEDEWPLDVEDEPRASLSRPVERPAQPAERLQAALLDLGVLASLAAIVLYFAGRAAKVPLASLQPAWPYLAGYLTLLALLYAMYFTGTTGQTLGKMLFDLRVVDTNGQAPGYWRALGRGALGALGTVALGLGLAPMLFDPARRGFHDRLFRTRVVRRR